jgi:hypothetical protein
VNDQGQQAHASDHRAQWRQGGSEESKSDDRLPNAQPRPKQHQGHAQGAADGNQQGDLSTMFHFLSNP